MVEYRIHYIIMCEYIYICIYGHIYIERERKRLCDPEVGICGTSVCTMSQFPVLGRAHVCRIYHPADMVLD